MFDTPVDKTIQEGLQVHAKVLGVVVCNVLKEYYHSFNTLEPRLMNEVKIINIYNTILVDVAIITPVIITIAWAIQPS